MSSFSNKTALVAIIGIVVFFTYTTASWRCGNLANKTPWPTLADHYSEKCYSIIDVEKHWPEAQIHCANLVGPNGQTGQGRLVKFDNRRSFSTVRQWLRDIKWHRNGVWMGARRCSHSSNGFCWVDDTPISHSLLANNNFWSYGQPASSALLIFDADCVQFRRINGWKARTHGCHIDYSFICEFPMLPLSNQPTKPTKPTTTQTPSTTTTTTGLMMPGELLSPSPPTDKDDDDNKILLIGLVVGGCVLVFLIILAIILFCVCRRRRAAAKADQKPMTLTVVPALSKEKEAEANSNKHTQEEDNNKANEMVEVIAPRVPPKNPPPAYRVIAASNAANAKQDNTGVFVVPQSFNHTPNLDNEENTTNVIMPSSSFTRSHGTFLGAKN